MRHSTWCREVSAGHRDQVRPCTPAGSSRGCGRCACAAFEPSRHILLSDSRGSITGIRAWSANPVEGAGHRQDIVLPVFLVCTIFHPPARTSSARPAVQPVAQNLFIITTAHSSAVSPWRSPTRRHPARWRSDHRRKRCHRATSHASPRRAFGRPPRAPWHGIWSSPASAPQLLMMSRPLNRVSSAEAAS
jgi:hypothetical protein